MEVTMTIHFTTDRLAVAGPRVSTLLSKGAAAGRLALLALAAATRPVARWWRNRQAMALLGGAEDAMLSDIGIGRSQIEDVVRNGRPPATAPARMHARQG
jgi:uncharacterized protein YjiS (DUF1127 family)